MTSAARNFILLTQQKIAPSRFSNMASSSSTHVSTAPNFDIEIADVEFSILLFAALKDAARSAEIIVRAKKASLTARELLELCAQQHFVLARWLPHVRVAVNQEYVALEKIIEADDEIAFLPPVAGGAGFIPTRSSTPARSSTLQP